jgi:hypothetical protein
LHAAAYLSQRQQTSGKKQQLLAVSMRVDDLEAMALIIDYKYDSRNTG